MLPTINSCFHVIPRQKNFMFTASHKMAKKTVIFYIMSETLVRYFRHSPRGYLNCALK